MSTTKMREDLRMPKSSSMDMEPSESDSIAALSPNGDGSISLVSPSGSIDLGSPHGEGSIDFDSELLPKRKKTLSERLILEFDGPFRTVWDTIMGVVLVYVCIWLLFRLAYFENDPPYFFLMVDTISDNYFIVDIVINFFTSYKDEKESIVVRNHLKIALRYFKTWFLIDIVSIIPFEDIFSSNASQLSKLVKVLRMLKLLKMLRLSKLGRLIPQIQAKYDIKNSTLSIIKFLLTIIITAHWSACSFFLIARWQDFHEDSWVHHRYVGDKPLFNCSLGTQYLHSIYWSITVMTTIGWGDILPGTDLERIFVMIAMIMGAFIFAKGVTKMCIVILNMDTSAVKFGELIDTVRIFLEHRRMKGETPAKKKKIKQMQVYAKNLLTYHNYHSYIDLHGQVHVLSKLSKNLREEFYELMTQYMFEGLPLLEAHGLFFHRLIAGHLVAKIFTRYNAIMLEGYQNDNVFLVGQGEVEIVMDPTFVYQCTECEKWISEKCWCSHFGGGLHQCPSDCKCTNQKYINTARESKHFSSKESKEKEKWIQTKCYKEHCKCNLDKGKEEEKEEKEEEEKDKIVGPSRNIGRIYEHDPLCTYNLSHPNFKPSVCATRVCLSEGSTFNEVACLLAKKSTLSVFATKPSDIYQLNGKTYLDILKKKYPEKCETLLKRNQERYANYKAQDKEYDKNYESEVRDYTIPPILDLDPSISALIDMGPPEIENDTIFAYPIVLDKTFRIEVKEKRIHDLIKIVKMKNLDRKNNGEDLGENNNRREYSDEKKKLAIKKSDWGYVKESVVWAQFELEAMQERLQQNTKILDKIFSNCEKEK